MFSLIVVGSTVVLIALTILVKMKQRAKLKRLENEALRDSSGTSREWIIHGGYGELFPAFFGASASALSFLSESQWAASRDAVFRTTWVIIMIVVGIFGPWAIAYQNLGEVFVISDRGIRKSSPFSREAFREWSEITRVEVWRKKDITRSVTNLSLRSKDAYGNKEHFVIDPNAKNIGPFYEEAYKGIPPESWDSDAREFFLKEIQERLRTTGSPGTPIFCESCGAQLIPGALVCPSCGRNVQISSVERR